MLHIELDLVDAYLEEDVRKAGTKIRSVNVKLLLSWEIYIVAPWTVHFDS